ncbi:MAG: orotate phosphoribosyltransferase [Candidatus Humimicrobiaceae bacterium]
MLKVVEENKNIDILEMLKETGAIMKGHFKLSSGYHSGYYLQCARLLQFPGLTRKISNETKSILLKTINNESIKTVVSPAMGGILYGYMLADVMGKRMIFTERKTEKMELRRGFSLKKGEEIIIAEDVITTGGSVREVIDICKSLGADIRGIVSIVDRSEGVDFGIPYIPLIKLQIDKYHPSECKLCKNNVDIDHPGSKK